MKECSLCLYQNILFKDVLASALKMDSLCGGLLCAVSTGASSQWRWHRPALNERRDLVVYRVALIWTGGLVKCNKMTGYSTKWKETCRFDMAGAPRVTENVHTGCADHCFYSHMCFYDLIFIMLLREHDRMVVEICGYSARSISLPFHLSLSLSLSLTHCGSVGKQKDISGAATRKKKREKCMKWWTASEGGSHATQSSQSKVTLALSKETGPLCWWPRLYFNDWMSKFKIAWWSHMVPLPKCSILQVYFIKYT